MLSLPAAGQALPGAVTPGRDRTGPQPPTVPPDFDFSILSTHKSPVPRAVDEVKFKIKEIRIVGASNLPDARWPIFMGFALSAGVYHAQAPDKEYSLGDLQNLADAFEQAYRDEGYLLVRAYVPPQRVSDGVFTINVVEGHIGSVSMQGGDSDVHALVRGYLRPAEDAHPLSIGTMERGLLLINDIPGVTATGVLRASPDTPGASDLIVDIDQPPLTGGLAVDDRGSRFSGIWTVAGDLEVNSIFGADQLAATLTVSPSSLEQIAGTARYRKAIGSDGLIGSMIVSVTHGEPGSTLSAADILTDSYAVGPRLTYPLIRSRAETLLLDGGITVQDASIYAGSPSSKISHDEWRVFDIGGSYQLNGILGGGAVWTTTFDLAQGLPFLGATHNNDPNASRVGAEFDFTKLTAFSRLAVPLIDDFGAVVGMQGQFSFSPLITGEQIAFGGTQIGRGYDPGAITGDDGLGASVELRYDRRIADFWVKAVEPYVYFDAAQTWYGRDPTATLKDEHIYSVGGGVRFWLPYDLTLGIEGAQTLHAVPGSDGGHKATKLLVDLAVRF